MYTLKRCILMGGASVLVMAATPAMAQDEDDDRAENRASQGDEIIVTGRRGAIQRANELERQADDFRSVVTSDDIGQFGDLTVAESLQRIPGVSINRANGEGQQVSIRGLPTEFGQVTVDGARLGSTDADINSTNLDFFSADNLSRIEVIKTLTPDQPADAIAGTVNLKTLSAFDRGRDSVGFRAQGAYQEKSEDLNPLVSGEFTKIFEFDNDTRLGVAGGVTWQQRDNITDQIEFREFIEFTFGEIYFLRGIGPKKYKLFLNSMGKIADS